MRHDFSKDKELFARATEGPWEVQWDGLKRDDKFTVWGKRGDNPVLVFVGIVGWSDIDDVDFFVESRTLWPRAVEIAEEAEKRVEELEEQLAVAKAALTKINSVGQVEFSEYRSVIHDRLCQARIIADETLTRLATMEEDNDAEAHEALLIQALRNRARDED